MLPQKGKKTNEATSSEKGPNKFKFIKYLVADLNITVILQNSIFKTRLFNLKNNPAIYVVYVQNM